MLLQEYLSNEYPEVKIILSGLLANLKCEQCYACFVSSLRNDIVSQISKGNSEITLFLLDESSPTWCFGCK